MQLRLIKPKVIFPFFFHENNLQTCRQIYGNRNNRCRRCWRCGKQIKVLSFSGTASELTDVYWTRVVFVWVHLYMAECVPGGGLHNHFQLSCVFDDLLCQLSRRDVHLFCPLLLTAKRVAAICTQSPSPLPWKHKQQFKLCSCACFTHVQESWKKFDFNLAYFQDLSVPNKLEKNLIMATPPK